MCSFVRRDVEASSAADDATNSNLTIILGSVLAGMVCVVVAAVIVRRRLRSVSGDEKMLHGANTAGGSMVFMDSTRPSSVPVLQSNNRVYEMPNLLALPAPAPTKKPPSTVPRTTSRRDEPRTEEASSLYRLSSMHHIPIVDCIDALGNMTRISEAENSDGSSAATTFDNHAADNGFAIDVRGTDDLCRFTRASEHYSESTYDGEFGDHVGFPSDVSRETGWSIGSENVAAPSGEWGGAAAPSHDVRNTDDLLQTTRSMVSIDDSSVRGSSDVWLDTNRFNAMVSTDVHIF
ncbi:hypothetical protein DYB32_003963 [Aphanomyces invadans]|uniref:Uncharacterized protein n=1 Tax=Aphanomyces invadans TaxID=157072 RepID=A0A3R7AAF0_9STRA|nr:hypothetical protein DYB32_003963 [Aphanomyces invadans]